jgi:hypothetical protein
MYSTDDWGPLLRGVVIAMLALCWVSTALRCYVRAGIVQKAFGLDDWMMILATVSICGRPTVDNGSD